MKTFLVYKNGFLYRKLESTELSEVVNFCDSLADNSKGDWITARVKGENDFYTRCDDAGIREVK